MFDGEIAELVEHLPSMGEAPGSIPSTQHQKERKRKKDKGKKEKQESTVTSNCSYLGERVQLGIREEKALFKYILQDRKELKGPEAFLKSARAYM